MLKPAQRDILERIGSRRAPASEFDFARLRNLFKRGLVHSDPAGRTALWRRLAHRRFWVELTEAGRVALDPTPVLNAVHANEPQPPGRFSIASVQYLTRAGLVTTDDDGWVYLTAHGTRKILRD